MMQIKFMDALTLLFLEKKSNLGSPLNNVGVGQNMLKFQRDIKIVKI